MSDKKRNPDYWKSPEGIAEARKKNDEQAKRLLELSNGHWYDILVAAGIPAESLSGKHGPCPVCSSEHDSDRFRFDNKDGTGSFFCSKSKKGKGYGTHLLADYLAGYHNASMHLAFDFLRKLYSEGGEGEVIAKKPKDLGTSSKKTKEDVEKIRKKYKALYSRSDVTRLSSNHPQFKNYLCNRGLSGLKDDLPLCYTIPAYELYVIDPSKKRGDKNRYVLQGRYPTILNKMLESDDQPVTIHATYLNPGSQSKLDKKIAPAKVLKPTCKIEVATDIAMRLYPLTTDELALSEGFESALSARLLITLASSGSEKIPVWSTHSCTHLSQFNVPVKNKDKIKVLHIFADHDAIDSHLKYRPGLHHAELLIDRKTKEGYVVYLHYPFKECEDFNDILLNVNKDIYSGVFEPFDWRKDNPYWSVKRFDP